MNVHTVKALVQDALYQVLDNSVFRILALLTAVPILATFLFGFREDRIVFLFGMESWSYEPVLNFLAAMQGMNARDLTDPQGLTIEAVLTFVFDTIVGTFGVLFCIAATAFFVPRMIEKGAADVLFHKPISRLVLYLARYLAGLLFIGLLSLLLVTGMYLGLLFVSGHHDLGVFFAAFQLTYVFGLIYAVCMLIGIVTRSTVASILLTVMFFAVNGCIHTAWVAIEQNDAKEERLKADAELAKELVGEGEADEADEAEEDDEEVSIYLRALVQAIRAAHYVLPKTNDGPIIARKLRASFDRLHHRDEDSRVALYALPSGAPAVPLAEVDARTGADELGDDPGELRLAVRFADPPTLVTLWRRPLREEEVTARNRTIVRRENPTRAASALEDVLEDLDGTADVDRDSLSFGGNSRGQASFGSSRLDWTREVDGSVLPRIAVLFRGAESELLYTLLFTAEAPLPPADGDEAAAPLQKGFEAMNRAMALDTGTEATWYSKQVGLDAPWRYNLIFSVGSSVAFAALMLLCGWWRLSRIEF